MARPQSPDYDKRRDAIIATAAKLYARRGFQGASVADLAKACNTSKSLVYHYFPSKEDILYEVMAAHLEALVDAADDVMRRGDAKERLRALALAFMRLYEGAQDHHKVLLNELDNLPSERRAEVVRKQRRIIAVVENLIQTIRPDAGATALPLTMLFFGMINWTHTWFRPDGAMSAEELAYLAVDLMLNGLGELSLR
ncbi:TetR/AcrR family transcriptional regulator [Sphingosinicella humi]|uniref:TetR/AcrR family transcriptional regulator n=1 Tax=Allosphingosinicella humi TaxID=2068657 RepID=A0A2U2IZI7_9SPHN|nr:TetR/AcrR family transcriptional regulator [Sphingosinicella humi]PWG01494.1 TetR/AcrR family transcriptional regulator [Sphingosinicella humi]